MLPNEKDLDTKLTNKIIRVNIYADEIFKKECPFTKDEWFYIGIIVDIGDSLLDDIISERFYYDFDESSPYYNKNNKIVHWSELVSADTKNICKRWFKYILDAEKGSEKFYSYILGVNFSKLNDEEFDVNNLFNSEYNRFFRSAILYALKSFFSNKQVIVENIYHEEGQQKYHEYFSWHCIKKINQEEKDISFRCNDITFLAKNHKKNYKSNLLQLSDAFMGACTSIFHGIKESSRSKYREELTDMILPLVLRMTQNPNNPNSRYKYANRIMMRFFPRENTGINDLRRNSNQYFTKRQLYYQHSKRAQGILNFKP